MQLQNASKEIFQQLIQLLNQLEQSEFTRPLSSLSNHTIGKHVRHIIEFYECLLIGYQAGEINYDQRNHDTNLETSKNLAIKKIHYLCRMMDTPLADKSVILKASFDDHGQEAIHMESSFYREIQYNIEHTIHHLAIIRIAVQTTFSHIVLPAEFGVAYSTRQFQQQG